jgi:hypothetical protein
VQSNPNERSSTTRKWLIGCGIGCGVVIVIAALLITGGVFYVRSLVKGFEDSEALLETLTERYGRITEFCPDPGGRIPSPRIEAFLQARLDAEPVGAELARTLQLLSGEEDAAIDVESSGNVFQKIRMGIGLIPQVADFFKVRNQALLDAGMGMGEYYYLYTIIYFSWLGKPVLDGPFLELSGQNEEFRYRTPSMDQEDEEAREIRRDLTLRRLHRMLLPMLKNQYDKLTAESGPEPGGSWREALAAEIEALESDRYRLPWQDGPPEIIRSSLEPYRERLESSYNRWLNAIEITLEQH